MEAYKETMTAGLSDIICFLSNQNGSIKINVNPHWHTMTEVLYILEGEFKQQIDNNFFNTEKDDIVIIGEGQIHSTYALNNSKGSILVIQFYNDKFNSAKIDYSNKITSSSLIWHELVTLICEISKEYQTRSESSYFMIKSHIYKLQGLLISNKQDIGVLSDRKQENREFLINVFDFINNHYMNEINLNLAAQTMHLSVPHFLRIFKRATGMPFMQYLNLYRIQLSNKFLLETRSVAETAYLCGFNSETTYARLYKKYNYITPNQFLKN